MLWKKIKKFWKNGLNKNKRKRYFGVLTVLSLFMAACKNTDIKSDEFSLCQGDISRTVLEKIPSDSPFMVFDDNDEKTGKGYNLPVDTRQSYEAQKDCKRMMEFIREIYAGADKGEASNVVLSYEVLSEMRDALKLESYPLIMTGAYENMENFKTADRFLKKCMKGVSGSAVIYKIHQGGGIGRLKFIFDGKDMYVLSATASWDEEYESCITNISYNRIKEWKYTDKGWFCYEMCVPEPPEVTEKIDGSCMIRIKPISDEKRKMSEECLFGLSYQGNNLLCSDWDTEYMKDLDYNGLYEYLYAMKYGEKYEPELSEGGIPKEEFESLITEYLPISREEIQRYAVFDQKNQTYVWKRLGCFNYAPSYFETSFPEVTKIKENADGTITLTVDAVCRMVLCDDAVITHELKVRFSEDGSFKYLGNKILNGGLDKIPDYQYRVSK